MSKFYVNEIVFNGKEVVISEDLKNSIISDLKQNHSVTVLSFDNNCGSKTNTIILETAEPLFKKHVRDIISLIGETTENVVIYVTDDANDYYRRYTI